MKRYIKGVISFLLCTAIVASVGVSALAALEVSAAPEDAGNGTSILDDAVISERVNALIDQYVTAGYVKESELAIAYTYLATGDSWYKNPDMWFYSASIYKVPLMMIMAEKESKGEVDQQTDIKGLPLAQVEKIVLVDSNNDYAHNTMSYLTGETEKKSFEKGTRPMYQAFSSLPEKYYHKDFVEYSYFTARFMNDVMCTLYNEQSRFPNIIGLLKQAMPDRYYNTKLGGQYEIAQKYGYFKDSRQTEWHNNTGIIYTPNPIVLTVLSADAKKGEQFMGDLAELFADYTLELDSQLAAYKAEQERLEQERTAAEKAAAEAEAKAKAEEEARIAKAEADRKAAEEAALRAAEKEEKAAERKESISKILKYVGIAGAGVLVILIVVGILSSIRKRKALEEEEETPPARRRARKEVDFDKDEDDDEEDDEDDEDDDGETPRKSIKAELFRKKTVPSRRRSSDYDDEDDEDFDDEDDEDDEAPADKDDIDASLAYMKASPARSGRFTEEVDDSDEESSSSRTSSRSSGGYRPRH